MDYLKELQAMDDGTLQRRMYEGAPGSDWWMNCKAELDVRIARKQLANADKLAASIETLLVTTNRMESSSRRLELISWVLLAATIVMTIEPAMRFLRFLAQAFR